MALTATAQNKVQDDIIRQLRIAGCAVLKQSFNRPNLHYEIRPKDRNSDLVGRQSQVPHARGDRLTVFAELDATCQ
jgi:superfamily II DNA helicase RecQ